MVRTPVVRLYHEDAPAEIWLKLESLQPIGSFKLRGAANAILSAPRADLQRGVVTTSTGNMAQGVAWMARELDTETVASASLFVDRRESTLNESGDYLIPLAEGAIGPDHIKAELGEVLVGEHPGREHEDELTVFKSLGIAVEDLASAELVVRRARERGVGVEVDF
ncbi:MAG: pyridoxal-phosphate dependent enzyme [Gaiellaceae bacterium]